VGALAWGDERGKREKRKKHAEKEEKERGKITKETEEWGLQVPLSTKMLEKIN